MKIAQWSLQKKKKAALLLHILFLFFALTGISTIYLNSHYGKGLGWIIHETYEDTSVFSDQLKDDMEEVFAYVNYKEIFETDGRLDFSKPVVTVSGGPSDTHTYTLNDMVRYAKSRGLYLNEKFKITGQLVPNDESDGEELYVEWRSYAPEMQYKEPGDAYSSLDILSEEVLSNLGNYYSTYYKFIQNPSNLKFYILYGDGGTAYKLYSNSDVQSFEPGEAYESFQTLGKFLYATSESVIVDTNLKRELKNVTSLLESSSPYENGSYTFLMGVDTQYSYDDSYAKEADTYSQLRLLFIMGLICLLVGGLGCVVTLYYLMTVSGYEKPDSREIVLHSFDHVSSETFALICAGVAVCSLFIAERVGYRLIHLLTDKAGWHYYESLIRYLVIYGICMVALFSLVRRYKARTIWKNSLIKRMVHQCSVYFQNHDYKTRLFIQFLSYFTCNSILLISICVLAPHTESISAKIIFVILILTMLFLNLWIFYLFYRNAWQDDKINDALCRLSSGDTIYQIDTEGFTGKEGELAKRINHISIGLQTALDEQVKSERLKADLITNVSHDIKTPLTSIINYVDLIKREHIQDEKILGYLEILEQKSQRLKTLTEDLVEASKASSGNLQLEVTDIDFVELIWQTNGEFEEKFQLRKLELVAGLPEKIFMIEADGRRLWRVLENLYNNAFKYAMEHSRVYVDVEESEGNVSFVIKNISERPLNIHPEELTERFVRGDVARTTEGSGLGLSIAKSLTELQGGAFQIYIDGDLFKVLISFPLKSATKNQ